MLRLFRKTLRAGSEFRTVMCPKPQQCNCRVRCKIKVLPRRKPTKAKPIKYP